MCPDSLAEMKRGGLDDGGGGCHVDVWIGVGLLLWVKTKWPPWKPGEMVTMTVE